MRIAQILVAFLGLTTHPSFAVDLAKIDRTIRKEPAYKSQPKYCLLVFGPDAAHKVWAVLDGDVLYVDRNGNGDLTEDGERLEAKGEGDFTNDFRQLYKIGELRLGGRSHRMVEVTVVRYAKFPDKDEQLNAFLKTNTDAVGFMVNADVDMPDRQVIGGGRVLQIASYQDYQGYSQFANSAKDAPIIHFGGPLTISMCGKHTAKIGRETDFVLGVGTPGLGPGTTAWVAYQDLIPENVHPKVEITYPVKSPGVPPIKELYELKERC